MDQRLAGLLRAQHGAVARAQLRTLGLSDPAIDRRVQKGSLLRLGRGVYAVGHDRLTPEGRWMTGALLGGVEAVLSHRSAGALWGLCRSLLPLVEITIPRSRSCGGHRHLLVHRSGRLGSGERRRRNGIPVTTPARTCLDLAEVLDPRPLERALDNAYRLGLTCPDRLRAATLAHPGRIGGARLAAVLAEHDLGTTATANDFEERFLELCDRNGIPRPECNARVGPYRVDFMWREQRVIVETDGRATHATSRAFEADRARDVELGSRGWRVMRFTWRQLAGRSAWVAGKVLDATRSPEPSPRRSPPPP